MCTENVHTVPSSHTTEALSGHGDGKKYEMRKNIFSMLSRSQNVQLEARKLVQKYNF